MTKIPWVTDEQWISQNSCLAQKRRRRRRKLLYLHPNLSLGLVPIGLYPKVDIACKRNNVLDYSFDVFLFLVHSGLRMLPLGWFPMQERGTCTHKQPVYVSVWQDSTVTYQPIHIIGALHWWPMHPAHHYHTTCLSDLAVLCNYTCVIA